MNSTLKIGINHKKKRSPGPIEVIYGRTEVRLSQGITRLVFVFFLWDYTVVDKKLVKLDDLPIRQRKRKPTMSIKQVTTGPDKTITWLAWTLSTSCSTLSPHCTVALPHSKYFKNDFFSMSNNFQLLYKQDEAHDDSIWTIAWCKVHLFDC